MNEFVIRPRKGLEVVEPATEVDAQYWSIYEVEDDGTETWIADCVSREVAERFTSKGYALIEVRGGVAEVTGTKGKVEVAVVDWDNVNAGDEINPELLEHPVFGPWLDADRS
ncbi:hypothetical protein [Sulfuricystis multivorans]|uniref:hypothetical protein n=1 Tax=Sulfuricystis multivorans TaxID=2211108 RepID=UPI000F830B71|nr:hypothetical protein [Sulfuricystis multivorans]